MPTSYHRGLPAARPRLPLARIVRQATRASSDARRGLILPPHITYPNFSIDPFPAPPAAAISGMSSTAYKNYDWTGGTPLADWDVLDGNTPDNHELSTSKPSNVTVISDAACSGGVYLQLAMRLETYAGFAYTGVQMTNFYSGPLPGVEYTLGNTHLGYGQGNPFFIEARLRWTGFSGMWVGPWMYSLTTNTPAEIDLMETVNALPPRYALHSPNSGPTDYAASNDGNWHRYGIRADASGTKQYMDGVLVSTVNSGSTFRDANMGLKLQAYVGGDYPNGEAGVTTPVAGTTFPRFFDCDWIRIYR